MSRHGLNTTPNNGHIGAKTTDVLYPSFVPGRTIIPTQYSMQATIGVSNQTVKPKVAAPIKNIVRPNKMPSRNGPPQRGSVFTHIETKHLPDLIEKHQPLCKEEWDILCVEHKISYRAENRTFQILRRNFASLHRRRMPTGDPRIPEDVLRAKQLLSVLCERADMADPSKAQSVLEDVACNEQNPDQSQNHTLHMTESDNEGEQAEQNNMNKVEVKPLNSNRPLTRLRYKNEDENFNDFFRMSFLQDQQRRTEDDRRYREEREEDRRVRQEDGRRHQRLMEVILLALVKNSNGESSLAEKGV